LEIRWLIRGFGDLGIGKIVFEKLTIVHSATN